MQTLCRATNSFHSLSLLVLLSLAVATGCAAPVSPEPPSPSPTTVLVSPSPTAVPTSTPTATPVPPKELSVCLEEEPNTLFIYGGPSRAAWSVLDAVYDGPVDARDYAFEPVILERLPRAQGGDVAVRTVEVKEGERVLSAGGKVVELRPGVVVRDAEDASVTFDGGSVSMPQLVVTFTLRSDVRWADGEPLTADDSRFSYELAKQLEEPAVRRRVDRTADYEALDSHTLVWRGVPGHHDAYYLLNIFHPLPRHVLGDSPVERLVEMEVVRQRPLGWGPFAVEAWEAGEHIRLVRNPHYFRASEGLPYIDSVTFRFFDDPGEAVDELLSGGCDVVTEDLLAGVDGERLKALSGERDARLISEPSGEWEHLDFAIQPAPWAQRTAFFEDHPVRQAVAHCIDRQRIADTAFPVAGAVVAHSYVLPQHPLHAGDALQMWRYDPATGRAMLSEVGWRDLNEDDIREAVDVSGVSSGTVLSATLLTTQSDPARERVVSIIEENLADCGVGLSVRYLPPELFYADGPDGPVFGRQFDLALFSWLNGLGAPCELYLSTQIPSEDNWWATSNNPGYEREEYDAACQSAVGALYGTESHSDLHRQAQRIFSQDLPVVPLYFVPRTIAVRPEVDGIVLDPSQQTVFWNIEAVDLEQ